jgi:hypothetical protein
VAEERIAGCCGCCRGGGYCESTPYDLLDRLERVAFGRRKDWGGWHVNGEGGNERRWVVRLEYLKELRWELEEFESLLGVGGGEGNIGCVLCCHVGKRPHYWTITSECVCLCAAWCSVAPQAEYKQKALV